MRRSSASIIRPIRTIPGKKTLAGYAGLFSFEVTDDIDIPAFVDALKFFKIGVSLGRA